jgi:peptidoglycan/xylan/chitin deacetylase (PgdA/CDA1 family)
VAITFDDGRRTFVDTALDELLAEQASATLFVPSGLLGGAIPNEDAPLMTDDELAGLPHLIEVGSHGLTHVRESRLPGEQLKEELVRSQHDLEVLIGRPVDRHAYPYGDHSAAVVDVAHEVYRSCYTVTPHLAPPRSSWTIGRVVADPDDWPLEFWLKIRGAYRWMGVYMEAKQRVQRLLQRA